MTDPLPINPMKGPRQEWLDSLVAGAEVAVDFRTQRKGCTIFPVAAIIKTKNYKRAFSVHGMRFSSSGEYIADDDSEQWPGPCCLEDPDNESLGFGPQPSRREMSERWHAIETFGRLASVSEHLTTEQLVGMIRVMNPGYVPRW